MSLYPVFSHTHTDPPWSDEPEDTHDDPAVTVTITIHCRQSR